MTRLVTLCFFIILMTACATTPAEQPSPSPTPFRGRPQSVILDTDMAPDDWMAILYLLKRPDVTIKAITVTGAGEAHCGPGIRHALELVALTGHEDIPVACGRDTPLQGDHAFPATWREGADNLLSLTLPASSNTVSDQTAVELLTSVIRSSPEKVSLLTLGPLTNVAEALQRTPSLADNLEMIYIMGGAVEVAGNVGTSGLGIDNEYAEWNIYVDPRAANIVLASGAAITLVPLDATNHAPLTTAFFDRIKDNHATAEATFVFDLLSKMKGLVESGEYFFWDPLAAATLTDESLATFRTMTLSVVEEEGAQSGRTQPTAAGAKVRVAASADGRRFEQVFLEALNAPPQSTGPLQPVEVATGQIAFTRATSLSEADIYVMNVDGSEQTNLTDTPGFDVMPAWSPDGTRIAFVSNRDGNWEIYVMKADGSGQTRLTNNTTDDAAPAWSPDGTRIAFTFDWNGNPAISVLGVEDALQDVDGYAPTRLAAGNWPTWSPDGIYIAFTRAARWPEQDIWVMNADGSNQRPLTHAKAASEAAWSPDGSRIAFVSGDYSRPDAPLSWNEEIYVMNIDGSEQTRLTNIPGNDHWPPAWSPDGRRIAFTSDGAQCGPNGQCNADIYVMNADGTGLTQLTSEPAYDGFPAWQP